MLRQDLSSLDTSFVRLLLNVDLSTPFLFKSEIFPERKIFLQQSCCVDTFIEVLKYYSINL